ncbi:TetR/AcrR family transcriptional regulator [Hoeflea sp. WL0058]|uniref:TetR/AcrR family transcriptional regulator n=1 Tax=Flavimaribacter sediminis TaxID=2865987 RepID=A0AAE3CY36_9HYPH|nr:TetR/AcrR family transcriptional regulator [Flavimaribacter sediminis]MBW8635750.1 TetR/AcrR family transcriptional regulator [Flavimaribacter sediminis]
MQELPAHRTNRERTETTTSALIAAARELFLSKGYAGAGTPEIVKKAGVTRGALYHHFEDKKALFAAVIEAELSAVADQIERAAPDAAAPFDALVEGGRAFFDAMAVEERTRLILIEAPAVLGWEELRDMDRKHGGRTLQQGLDAAMKNGVIARLPLETLATMLSALFDRGALAIEGGADPGEVQQVIVAILDGLRR